MCGAKSTTLANSNILYKTATNDQYSFFRFFQYSLFSETPVEKGHFASVSLRMLEREELHDDRRNK
jgi:hypothetical protein